MIQRIRNNAFARNSLILFIGTMAASVLNYVFHLAIGRMVNPIVYGEVESLVALVAIVSVPAGSLTMIVTKLAAGNKAEGDRNGSHQLLVWYNRKVLLYGLPIFFLMAALSSYINDFLQIENIWPLIIVWLMMLLSFFAVATGGILNGWQKFAQSSWAGIWGALAKLIFALIFVYLGFSLMGAMGGYALGVLVSYAISLYFLKFIKNSKSESGKWKEAIRSAFSKKYLWAVFFGNLAIAILSNVDMVLAKHNLDPETAGQYGALTIISKIIFFATGVVGTVLFSMSSESSHKKDNSGNTLKHALSLMSLICAGALVVYYLFPEFIMNMLFGDKYQSVSSYLVWFAISVVLFSFVNLIFQYLLSINETKIAYGLLAVSLAASVAVLFAGKDILAIISIMIVAQGLSISGGLYFLLRRPPKPAI